ncbi:MAG: putative nucleotidyltransferase substrate binding domain-containing protein [Thermodesulfobacteriota bacterium]|nr:putative nucleotidyltransferase substrate binding domain-containing protein [Thermodesulfobacteriota bacterium]
MPDIKQLLDTEPFNHLTTDVLEKILATSSSKTFAQHYHIFNQNDPDTGYLYVIKEGLVEITLLTPAGEEIIIEYRHAGDTFGCTPIFAGGDYTGGARTVKTTHCYLIPKQLLTEITLEAPAFKTYFEQKILKQIRNLYANIVTEHSQKALTHVESYPFKKRLSEIMSTPVASCNINDSARVVAQQMAAQQIRSMMVVNNQHKMVGMITCKDIIAKVVAPEGSNADEITAEQLMLSNPPTMTPQTFMYEAMSYMVIHRLKHLPILDGDELVGMVSMSDLIRYRSQEAMLMIGNIKETTSMKGLAAIHKTMVRVAHTLLSETHSAPEVMETLSYIHHAITKRTYELCWQQMIDTGHTPPDIRYCFFLMGSGGRREMQLGPDQDNGFIFENFPEEQQTAVDAFFIPFADKLVHALDFVGYPLCEGDVMVSNEAWRGRLKDWEQRIADWAANPEPFKVRYSSIFFDFTPLVGDHSLAHSLQSSVFKSIRKHPGFLYNVMRLNLTHKVPIGLWGRFTTEKNGEHTGQLSLKKGGLIYIVDCLRMFALEYEIRSLTTLERLKQLTNHNVFSNETAEHIRVAFEALTFLRLRNEISLVQNDQPPSSYIDPSNLSKTEQDLLYSAFQAVSKLQSTTRNHFGKGLS